ncbi:HAD family hydrolase [Streptomyces scopuliridis]|uniref:HAD family hydrolase n=1 Tax=Streptomyces scopuliridis TaxID=452529 RepID=UPI002DDB52DB|nr:HAD family hydrolase [Streptomyces scopuliridis]
MNTAPGGALRGLTGVGLVVFDCDGVLVDTERIGPAVVAELATEAGWPLTPDEVREWFLGRPESYLYAEIRAHADVPVGPDWLDTYRTRLRDAFTARPFTMPGVGELLDALDGRLLPYCVASSGGHERIEHSLTVTGLWERFAGRVFSADDVAHGKPAPDLFLHAARALGTPPDRCLVIEDSPAGVDAALAAGMPVVGYAGGPTPPAALGHATHGVIHDLRQLLDS